MSRTPSTLSPPPSSDAGSNDAHDDAEAILAAAEAMADRGIFGLVWLDQNQVVTARYGVLANFVPVGVAIGEALPPLDGLESTIQNLEHGRDNVFLVPAVRIRAPGAPKA